MPQHPGRPGRHASVRTARTLRGVRGVPGVSGRDEDGGVHHVELLWDEGVDRAVRAQWDLLHEADLPSLARHRSASNAPHTTVTMQRDWPEDAAERLGGALEALPLEAALGALACFGRGPFVLVRAVVVTAPLLALHARVAEVLTDPARAFLAPGSWTPHVTLANRLDAAQVARALDVLGPTAAPAGAVVAARHWDADARALHRLAGPSRPDAGDEG